MRIEVNTVSPVENHHLDRSRLPGINNRAFIPPPPLPHSTPPTDTLCGDHSQDAPREVLQRPSRSQGLPNLRSSPTKLAFTCAGFNVAHH
ncbi:hypothetical protein E2C01_031828 [Portunus trituberculatus]|uniref:Uncharacterized protein n=1 Tax=Portunus trituberculatus TaxID=210409 RepID=A0A5B7EZN3_PORTR|nr:hypothetical protein [Portunus trituberculatus]